MRPSLSTETLTRLSYQVEMLRHRLDIVTRQRLRRRAHGGTSERENGFSTEQADGPERLVQVPWRVVCRASRSWQGN